MAKVPAFQLISLFLVVSLTAPSLLAILDTEGQNYVSFNLNEEEEKEQSEIKYDEANLFVENNSGAIISVKNTSQSYCDDYLNLAYSISVGIELPPPEQSI